MYNRTVTPDRMRKIELDAIESGVSSFLLMEHAAVAVADEIISMLPSYENAPVLFICGPGNNGGDGFAAARIFAIRGGKAEVLFIGGCEHLSGDAETNFNLLNLYGISVISDFEHITKPALIVDAIFGIGLSRPPEGVYREAIRAANELSEKSKIPILSIDIPSGVDASNGSAIDAIKANRTITFEWAKPGHYLYPGRFLCGEIIIKPIGLMAILGESPDGPEIIDGIEKIEKRHPTPTREITVIC